MLMFCITSFIGMAPARAGDSDWAIPSGPLPEPPPVNDPVPVPDDDNDDNTSDPLPEPTWVPDKPTQPSTNQQPTSPQPAPVPVVDQQKAFERAKETLLREFHMPAILADDALSVPDAPPVTDGDGMGDGVAPAGIADSDWKDASDCQESLDAIYSKWPLSPSDAAEADKLEARRNALWAKAISVSGLSASDRQRLRMQIPTPSSKPDAPVTTISADTVKGWLKPPPLPVSSASDKKPAPTENPVASWLVGQFALGQLQSKIEDIGEDIADGISEENSYGDFLGVGKIAMAYKDGGASSAIAETVNYLVGKIPIPRSDIAIEGGRQYANVAFQAENKFMTDAMNATGGKFDKEKFWSDFTNDLNVYQKAVKEWIGFGTD